MGGCEDGAGVAWGGVGVQVVRVRVRRSAAGWQPPGPGVQVRAQEGGGPLCPPACCEMGSWPIRTALPWCRRLCGPSTAPGPWGGACPALPRVGNLSPCTMYTSFTPACGP